MMLKIAGVSPNGRGSNHTTINCIFTCIYNNINFVVLLSRNLGGGQVAEPEHDVWQLLRIIVTGWTDLLLMQ